LHVASGVEPRRTVDIAAQPYSIIPGFGAGNERHVSISYNLLMPGAIRGARERQ
jgi:hypothetical protein